MVTTKLAVLEFLTGAKSGRLWLCGLSLCVACSVYDPRLLPSRGSGSITGTAGEPSAPDASGGDADAAVIQCGAGDTRCERPHSDAHCSDGECVITRCRDGYVDCDGMSDNGCEAMLNTAQNCGLCGATCRYNRGVARCAAGRCELDTCESGYGNCDDDDDNGCETDLNTLSNCGGCGKTCGEVTNAQAGCKAGKCGVGNCAGPYGDCDDDAANGCEQKLDTSEHCGACNGKCSPAHGQGSCSSGTCLVTSCEQGYADCNGRAADGCETKLDSIDHCGACGISCELAHVTQPSCARDGDKLRCEVTHACDPESAPCKPGAKETGCEAGYSDCDGDPTNGCETNLSRLSDCGSCDNSCVKPNTNSECRNGKCEITGCAPGAARCNNSAECRSLATDPQNCGQCGQVCTGAAMLCAGGKCTPQMCSTNRADCDADQSNGCENDLTSPQNCGVCGQRCQDPSHANAACRAGACAIGSCQEGWKDCDGEFSNGCEVNIRTTNDCGDCAKPCIAANADTSCSSGTCQITTCSDGRGNCNNQLVDGCEADFGLPATCGGCGIKCAALMDVASSSCDDGRCSLVCAGGKADCDSNVTNGCEADLGNAATCGSCRNNCNQLANVMSATCDGGTCKALMCRPGFADCNGDPADGCERSLTSATDCGACNRACAPAHGRGECNNGNCGLMGCDPGFDDCNRRAADGCEAPLSAPASCGTCGNACPPGAECMNGKCGCSADADCGPGLSCCDGGCANTATQCFLWPCIPGFERPESQANCGGCGMLCLLWCCAG
jgi:hypothetical protein